MRYPASEKLEIIRLVERVPPAVRARWPCSASRGPRSTAGTTGTLPLGGRRPRGSALAPGPGLEPHPDEVRRQIVDLALEEPELSPRELAVRFTDTQRYFVSEASVYRLLKAHDLVTSPALRHQGGRRVP
jgi:putative transposase